MVETWYFSFLSPAGFWVFFAAQPYLSATCPEGLGSVESDLSLQICVLHCPLCPSPLWLALAHFAWGCWWLNSVLDTVERGLKYCSRCKSQCVTVDACNYLASMQRDGMPRCFPPLQAIYSQLHFDLLSKTEWIPFVCKQHLGERKR